jgi:uncharacterized damage-inducible protein DinB
MPTSCSFLNRRSFLSGSAAFGALLTSPPLAAMAQTQAPAAQATTPSKPTPMPQRARMPRMVPPYDKATINLIGPRAGYTPQIGTFVSMLTWMQLAVLRPTRGLTQPQLDYLLDKKANSVGALMLHLAATEVLYQRITFNNEDFERFPPDYEAKWGAAMNLGDAGRATIKGHDITFYQDALADARERTLAEFAKRDDAWFLTPLKQPGWGGGPINNYCLWFHVCEHISHHAGQIDLLMKRIPGVREEESGG